MSSVKHRRRLTAVSAKDPRMPETLHAGDDGDAPALPPGRRDESGFWFPARYDRPTDIFSEQQRELQAKQRTIQRHRHKLDRALDPRPREIAVPLPTLLSEGAPSAPPVTLGPLAGVAPRAAAAGGSTLSSAAGRVVDSRRASD